MGRVLLVGFVDLSGGVLLLSDLFLDYSSFLSIPLILISSCWYVALPTESAAMADGIRCLT